MLVDLIMTTFNRPKLLRRCLESLRDCKDRDLFRLTVVHDGSCEETREVLKDFKFFCDNQIFHCTNRGLGPCLNESLAFVDALKKWGDHVPLTCYLQDDTVVSEHWLKTLAERFLRLEGPMNLAFATGHDAVEHREDPRAERKPFGTDMYLSKYIRATCMLARHTTWMSMWPIPRIDPETGIERGRPHDGLGSGVDWHFMRVHQFSVVKTRKTNLVIPGLVVHAGYAESTWLKRELPESETDKEILKSPAQKALENGPPKIRRECETCGRTMFLYADSQRTECTRCEDGN